MVNVLPGRPILPGRPTRIRLDNACPSDVVRTPAAHTDADIEETVTAVHWPYTGGHSTRVVFEDSSVVILSFPRCALAESRRLNPAAVNGHCTQ